MLVATLHTRHTLRQARVGRLPLLLQEYPDYMERVLRSFWVRSWSEDQDVHTVEDITAVGRAAGMQESQIQRCLQLMATPAVKSKLKVL